MKLIQYKGGGYDGCFWEWNFAVLDNSTGTNVYHDIKSSGHNGCKTLTALKQLIRGSKGTSGEPNYYIYNLNKKEDVKDFVENSQEGQVLSIAGYLEQEFDIELEGKCDYCRQDSPLFEMQNTSYRGDGGVGIQHTGYICNDCYISFTCERCDELIEPNENLTECNDKYLCEDCLEQEKEYLIDQKLTHIIRLVRETKNHVGGLKDWFNHMSIIKNEVESYQSILNDTNS